MISLLENPTSLRIQKSMFLYSLECGDPVPYAFFPNQKGCYSINLHDDYHVLQNQGYLSFCEHEQTYSVTSMEKTVFAISDSTLDMVRSVSRHCNCLTDSDLIRYTYSQKPFYALRSEMLSLMKDDETFQIERQRISSIIYGYTPALFTIGYEGQDIDKILRSLIRSNVKTLVDVRKNAFSMRREFSKQSLSDGCKQAGIKYIHCPEVGIESAKRQELLPDGKRKELFDWYEANTLPRNIAFVDKMSRLFHDGSICFLCYEKNPADCHRSRLANFCLMKNSVFGTAVRNL